MTDAELRTAFESCTLPRALWNHRAHVRMAYLYVAQHPFDVALGHMRQSIQEYNRPQQIPAAPGRGYHETITVAFMRLVYAQLMRSGPFPSSDAFCDCHPEFLDKSLLLRFYSKNRILSEEARRTFVEPDLAELVLQR